MPDPLPLSDDQYTVLMIAAEGEMVAPIGRWEKAVKACLQAGYMRRVPTWGDPQGAMNNTITELGRKALSDHEAELKGEFTRLANKVVSLREEPVDLQVSGDQAAHLLASMVKNSVDPPRVAMERWIETIRARAVQIIDE